MVYGTDFMGFMWSLRLSCSCNLQHPSWNFTLCRLTIARRSRGLSGGRMLEGSLGWKFLQSWNALRTKWAIKWRPYIISYYSNSNIFQYDICSFRYGRWIRDFSSPSGHAKLRCTVTGCLIQTTLCFQNAPSSCIWEVVPGTWSMVGQLMMPRTVGILASASPDLGIAIEASSRTQFLNDGQG